MPTASEPTDSNYYEILLISQNLSNALTRDDVKTAYHRALLRHHPDKTPPSPVIASPHLKSETSGRYSIGQIVEAYQTLSDPTRRAAYNRTLNHNNTIEKSAENAGRSTHIGVETVDLDELSVDEATLTWHRGCRCGDETGYTVTEEDLERESGQGEVYVGCRGCSLFIKVLFSATERDGQS